ncbi:hypothetical protein IV203_023472 [Nitzschia inconspicua]|uniref:Uncharacterized protein n=1 Tax=Nitzschia inconspicua TaxID=303405 RepID=A0A9K3KEA7_9STRA|nr:hypothetical protein IV203_023472 [Nitzschia inconspicua]
MKGGGEDMWDMPMKEEYHAHIRGLMGLAHGCIYRGKEMKFTKAQLLQLKPKHVYNYLCLKVSSLEYYKKAISFFLPNSHPWVEMPGTPAHGNPTRSKLVNNLVAKVRLAETRGEGKDTQATRPLEMIEYKAILSTFRATPGPILQMKVKNPLMVLYQWHLITRIDDVCNFKVSDPRPHPKWQSGPSALDRGDERSKFQPVCCRLWPNHTE